MTEFKVICRECGIVKKNIKQNGEVAEPSSLQKAQIVADEHERKGGNSCLAFIQRA